MSKEALQALENNIANNRKQVELGDAITALIHDRNFKTVVLQGYLREEAIRLVHLKADPRFQSPESQADILGQINAIGNFKVFLDNQLTMADFARKSIAADEEARTEILTEGLQ